MKQVNVSLGIYDFIGRTVQNDEGRSEPKEDRSQNRRCFIYEEKAESENDSESSFFYSIRSEKSGLIRNQRIS